MFIMYYPKCKNKYNYYKNNYYNKKNIFINFHLYNIYKLYNLYKLYKLYNLYNLYFVITNTNYRILLKH